MLKRYVCCQCGRLAVCDANHMPKHWSPARQDEQGNDRYRCGPCHRRFREDTDTWKHRRPFVAQE